MGGRLTRGATKAGAADAAIGGGGAYTDRAAGHGRAAGALRQPVQEAAAEAGRANAVTPALYVTVTLDADQARARAELEEYAGGYFGAPLEVMAQLPA